jgi:hypothetical protein
MAGLMIVDAQHDRYAISAGTTNALDQTPRETECPKGVDAVEKVENRTTPKISQMVIFWTTPPLRCSVVPIRRSVVVFQRHDVVPHVAAHETHREL